MDMDIDMEEPANNTSNYQVNIHKLQCLSDGGIDYTNTPISHDTPVETFTINTQESIASIATNPVFFFDKNFKYIFNTLFHIAPEEPCRNILEPTTIGNHQILFTCIVKNTPDLFEECGTVNGPPNYYKFFDFTHEALYQGFDNYYGNMGSPSDMIAGSFPKQWFVKFSDLANAGSVYDYLKPNNLYKWCLSAATPTVIDIFVIKCTFIAGDFGNKEIIIEKIKNFCCSFRNIDIALGKKYKKKRKHTKKKKRRRLKQKRTRKYLI